MTIRIDFSDLGRTVARWLK